MRRWKLLICRRRIHGTSVPFNSQKLLTMTRLFLSIAFAGITCCAAAQGNNATPALSPGARLIFGNVKTRTSAPEKNAIYQKLQLKIAKDKRSFELEGQPVEVKVYPADLNKDGMEEVFVTLSSGALFGNVGQTVLLFMKDKAGKYQQQTEIAGGIPVILKTSHLGYADIVVAGPGMEHPAFRWNGKDYRYYSSVKDEALSSAATYIEEFSKAYTRTLQ